MTEAWTKWESQVVNGIFPLRRFLGGSDHSAVFLTEVKAHQIPNAAIKLIPADPATAEVQLSHWRTAASLSHPHLIQLFDAGRCQLGGHQFLFLVTEYAEETLSQILPQRALTADEVREMLAPTLDALAFLHGKNLVQGQLKPSNFLVVNDQLKLASDTIRRFGESAPAGAKSSLYEAPEAKSGKTSPAGDIWALGVTLVEALTQCPPAWPDSRSEAPSLPTTLPASFADTVRRCLSRNPENRPTVADLAALIKGPSTVAASVPQVSPAQPTVSRSGPSQRASDRTVDRQPSPSVATSHAPDSEPKRWLVPAILAVLILVAIWGGWRLFLNHPDTQQPATTSQGAKAQSPSIQTSPQTPDQPAPTTKPSPATSTNDQSAETMSAPPPSTAPSHHKGAASSQPSAQQVVHEEIPDVPRSARNTVHGRIKVNVRVTVDGSGNVTDQTLETPGPSKYFARLASEAAMKWKFVPSDNQDSREWLLRFEFSRGGTTAHAVQPHS
jgi:TonB family protein